MSTENGTAAGSSPWSSPTTARRCAGSSGSVLERDGFTRRARRGRRRGGAGRLRAPSPTRSSSTSRCRASPATSPPGCSRTTGRPRTSRSSCSPRSTPPPTATGARTSAPTGSCPRTSRRPQLVDAVREVIAARRREPRRAAPALRARPGRAQRRRRVRPGLRPAGPQAVRGVRSHAEVTSIAAEVLRLRGDRRRRARPCSAGSSTTTSPRC